MKKSSVIARSIVSGAERSRTMRRSNLRFVIYVFAGLSLLLAACANDAPPVSAPAPTAQIVQVIATPVAPSATPTLAPKPTATIIPTPFVTAPAPGGEAHVPILMYHHIADLPIDATQLQLEWTVTPKNFDAQMQWLARNGFRSISMAQLVAHLKNRQ
ncbi:MAG: hypothetical protein L0Y55_01775, partial [Anaerolineales bacterium]|nr:hypothetical protein [Anaerolineales bacterium]